jgi:hypothetical protein
MKAQTTQTRHLLLAAVSACLFYAAKTEPSQGWFDLLHWAVSAITAFYSWQDYAFWKRDARTPLRIRSIILFGFTVLFNPVVPVRFTDSEWREVSVIAATAIICVELGFHIWLISRDRPQTGRAESCYSNRETVTTAAGADNSSNRSLTIVNFILCTCWIPALIGVALLLGYRGNAVKMEGLIERLCMASLWIIAPAFVVRFLLAKSNLGYFSALLYGALFWFNYSLMYCAFSANETMVDMAGDAPAIITSLVPAVGPILTGAALNREVQIETRANGIENSSRSSSSTERVPSTAIALMVAISISVLRWRHPEKKEKPTILIVNENDAFLARPNVNQTINQVPTDSSGSIDRGKEIQVVKDHPDPLAAYRPK